MESLPIGVGVVNLDKPLTNMHLNARYNPDTHLYDIHNFALKFYIKKYNHAFKKGKQCRMRGWSYRTVKHNGYTFNVKPNCIEVYGNERILTKSPFEAEKLLVSKLMEEAISFALCNGFELHITPSPIRKEVKCKDFRVAENFRTKNFKSVYPLPSPVEFTNKKTAVKDSVKFITHIDKIEFMLSEFSEQLKLHLQVQQEQLKTQRIIQQHFEHKSFFQKIKEFFA